MKKMIVKGSQKLSGEVTIGGAKNNCSSYSSFHFS